MRLHRRSKIVTVVFLATGVACGGRSALFADTVSGANPEADAGSSVPTPEAGPPAPAVDASLPDTGTVAGDAGAGVFDATGIPEVAKCLQAANAIYAVATGYAGLNGTLSLTGPEGTWLDVGSDPAIAQVNAPDGGWVFVASANASQGDTLGLGTYNSVGYPGAYAQVKVDGVGCHGYPTGTFTIVDLAERNDLYDPLVRLLAWFDLTCGDAGRIVGCARFTR
jgi:hypothetical protein